MRNECWEKDGKRDAPRTLDQSVSIVRENSYIVIVNPTASSEYNDSEFEAGTGRTVYLVIVSHIDEGIRVYVAVKAHARPVRGSVRPARR